MSMRKEACLAQQNVISPPGGRRLRATLQRDLDRPWIGRRGPRRSAIDRQPLLRCLRRCLFLRILNPRMSHEHVVLRAHTTASKLSVSLLPELSSICLRSKFSQQSNQCAKNKHKAMHSSMNE